MLLYTTLIILLAVQHTTGEWFTSICQMENLFDEELSLLNSLKQYLQSEQTKLGIAKSVLERVKGIVPDPSSNKFKRYVENPVSQYLLMFRFHSDWEEIFNSINFSQYEQKVGPFKDLAPRFPTEEDVYGAMYGLMRIRNTYDLPAGDIANGIVGSVKNGSPLLAMDVLEFGKQSVNRKEYSEAIAWLREAAIKVEEGDKTCQETEILYMLSRCFFELGNFSFSNSLLQESLKMDPSNEELGEFYNQIHEVRHRTKPPPSRFKVSDLYERKIDLEVPKQPVHESQEFCGKKSQSTPENIRKHLHCYLWDNHKNPRLLFRPARIEELWTSPHVLRIYGILSDNEIEFLITTYKHQLERAGVVDPETYGPITSDTRITKNTFLADDSSFVLQNINQRIADISGLYLGNGEMLSLANYGVGGYYIHHYDYFVPGVEELNRLATMLFYLNDVEQGGSTIFLHNDLIVPPIKGSAVFWFNLLENGKPDIRTMHAGCPVITGTKWIANKWILEKSECPAPTCSHPPCEDKPLKFLLST